MAEQRIVIRLLVFSGRPDPSWEISGASAESLANALKVAAKGESAYRTALPGLGYRGFLIQVVDTGEGQKTYQVYRGVVTESVGPRERYFVDSAGIEKRLLDDARERGYGDMLKALNVEDADR